MTAQDSTPQLLNRLRMRQVALMLAIEEQRTLRAAAAQLGMTQPAATKMLQELEDALGQPLFERVGRGLRLNAAGDCVMGHFHGLRGTVQALMREIEELRLGSAGKLRIGSIMAASPDHLTDAILQLKRLYPLMAVEVAIDTSDRLTEQLREGLIDVVIGRVPNLSRRDFLVRPIAEEKLVVVAATGHPLAGKRSVSFEALQQYPWILQPLGSPMREVLEQEFRSRHTPLPRGLIETSSILTTTNLLTGSEMIAVFPESVAGRYRQHGLLGILRYPLVHQLPSYGSIVRRDRPATAMARRFLGLLHGEPAST